MGKFTQIIRKFLLCSGETDEIEYSDSEYRSVHSLKELTPPSSPLSRKQIRFGASADCTLTSRNIETMYDIEEDLTVVAERAAHSASVTAELLETLLDLVDPNVPALSFSYGNKPCLRAELE